jgi:rhamnosyltransferase subunit B
MARILLGWELGAGNGHIWPLLEMAATLAARGHEPLIAPQQIGPFAADWPTWQAPVWPRLLEALSRRDSRRPATLGDSLAFLGLNIPEAVTAMIKAWDRLLLDTRPDAVIAEYAPMLLVAAKGRIPLLASGNGFALPPDDMPAFPSFFGNPPVVAEASLLATFNDCLRQTGREPLAALPNIFEADHSLVATFEELDPYRKFRNRPVAAPAIAGNVPLSTGKGEEIFIYFNGSLKPPETFWRGLINSRLPIRIHSPQLTDGDADLLEREGLIVSRKPLPFEKIVERSRLLLSHGGLGFVSSGLLAGLPQLIFPFDGEKQLAANAIAGKSGCIRATFDNLDPHLFSTVLRKTWSDDALQAQAQASAPGFRERIIKRIGEEAADIVEKMV